MTWSNWQLPPFITSVFFILGVFTLYWVTFNWLISWVHSRHMDVTDEFVNNLFGVIYMLIFVFSIQTLVVGKTDSWIFMNFQLLAITFCAYYLNIHIPYYFFFPIVLVYMVFNHSIGYWQSWGHAITLMAFFWTLNVIRVRFHDKKSAPWIYLLVTTGFGGPLWFWMRLKFNLTWGTFWQEWLYMIIFEELLYMYVSMLSHDVKLKLQLTKFASHDALTKTGNFAAYTDDIKCFFANSLKKDLPLSMMMFDIDHFKNINDTYGHLAGDHVLQQVSSVVQTVLDANDPNVKFYRTGGEEFNIIFPGYKSKDTKIIVNQIFTAINHLQIHSGLQLINISISVGVSEVTADDKAPMDFYNRVDQNLYYSKRHGRMQVTVA
ncbi:GGDEF domain-containing protein [Companilactobacillus baiquanensis]|uniref:GGDEF domain-containing protein n=1 Tax=Companilactobacillus baiquanensis TaxID=2486005 RepID=A0ABW1UUM4_9LACO|nr:GGDEF domain-containing protein [Companilactobacillus baiquanensis]